MRTQFEKPKVNIFLFATIIFVIMLCFSLWYLRVEHRIYSNENMTINSQTGVWDLSEYDFSKGFAITSGSEEYIEGKLVSPQEFDTEEIKVGSTSSPVNTSRITIYMPNDNTYTIMGNSFDFAERIYINGELVKEIGTVGLSADTSSPDHSYLNIAVTPQNGKIEIVRQSNNFVHRDNGVASHILIGTPETMNRLHAVEYGITGVMIGLFITIAISHIFLFFLFQKHKAHLYFAILSLTWGLRLGVTGIKVFGEWFTFFSWEFMFRIEYMTVPITSAMLLLVAKEIFPNALPKLYLNLYVGGFLLYSAFCVFMPTVPLSHSMLWLQVAFILGSILLFFFISYKAFCMAKTKELGLTHFLFLVGIIPFVIFVIHDAFYYNRILLFGIDALLIDLALMIIIFTQTAVIYYDTAQKMILAYRAEQESRIETSSLRKAKVMHENFLRTLSHEMQIPLTIMSGYAQLTSQILVEDEKIDKASMLDKMRVIDDEARKLSRQVVQLLDASAMENGTFKLHLEKVDINNLLSKINTQHFPTMSDGSLSLQITCPLKLPMAYADENRLRGCILNILSNSIKNTETGGLSIDVKNENGFIQIAISDTGAGISPELLENLFDRYPEHRENKGNGLGLSIVAQTIEAQGGEIWANSKINEGTTITFTVPIWKEKYE